MACGSSTWMVGRYANPAIARLHRIADEGPAALTVFDILDEDGRAQFRAHLDEVRKGPSTTIRSR